VGIQNNGVDFWVSLYLVIRQARFERVNKSRVQKRNPAYEKQ